MRRNAQPTEFYEADNEFLDLVGLTPAIITWGHLSGRRVLLVEFAGCDLSCLGCDEDYTTGRRRVPTRTVVEAADSVSGGPPLRHRTDYASYYKIPWVVLTGGEPLRQNIVPLVRLLNDRGYMVLLETNGASRMPASLPPFVVVACSPKGSVHEDTKPHVRSLVYVAGEGELADDGLPRAVLDLPDPVGRPWPEFLGPVFLCPRRTGDPDQDRRNVRAVRASCGEHGWLYMPPEPYIRLDAADETVAVGGLHQSAGV